MDGPAAGGRPASSRAAVVVVVGVLVLLLAGVAVTASLLVSRASSGDVVGPREAAEVYAAALRDGDAAALRAAAVDVGRSSLPGGSGEDGWSPTLDQVSLDAQRAAAPVTDVAVAEVTQRDDARATAAVTYRVGDQARRDEVEVVRDSRWWAVLSPGWQVRAHLPRVLPSAPAQASALRLNGATVLADRLAELPGGAGVPVFPGASVLTAESPPGTTASTWTGVLSAGESAVPAVQVALSPQGEEQARAALDRWLDDCQAQTSSVSPGSCPLRVSYRDRGERQAGVRWTYAPSTWTSAKVGVGDDGGIVVTGVATGSVSFTDVVEVDGGPATTAVPRTVQLERPYALLVDISLDGEVSVRLREPS